RLIEGTFPDYKRVIPTEFSNIITIRRSDFTAAVERISIVAKDAQYNVINFDMADNQIHMNSQDPDHGVVEDSVECIMSGGNPLSISFNGRFILDVLKHCSKDEIFLKCRENSPMLIQDKDTGNCVFVVTPMRAR
ncbi:MAG: DNA polymerase III subunit beta, partial [Megasphaera micronuciformis]|nr:DNA polymerase III subunit beta [Megasphaera micronuciformis]